MYGISAFRRSLIPLLAWVVLSLPFVFVPFARPSGQPWPGCYLVAVPAGADQDLALSSLEKGGFAGRIVSPKSETVDFYDFSGMARIPLSEAGKRLQPYDSRLDAYIRSLDRYFDASAGDEAYRLFYIRSSEAPAFFTDRVRRALSGIGGFRLVGTEEGEGGSILYLGAFLLMAGGCLLIFRRIRAFTLLGALPWLFIGWRGDFYALLFSLIGYFASVVFFEAIEGPVDEYVYSGRIPKPADIVRLLVPALAVGAVGILPMVRMSGPLLLLLAAPISTLPLAIAVALAMRVLKRDDEHRVFRSLPLRPGRLAILPAATPSFRKAVVLMVAVVAAAGILSLSDSSRPAVAGGANSGEALSIPLPKRYTASRSWDFPDLMRIIEGHGKSETGELPDLADFVVHEAYQQGLAYGRVTFRLPTENEAVTVADFVPGPDGTLAKTDRVAVRFSRAWLSTVLNRQGLPPLERMLFDLGSPSIVKRLPYAPSVSALPETGAIVISAAVFAVLGLFAAGAGRFRRKVRAIVTWSKQQET